MKRHSHNGFTLIELLVVISIVSLLMAILLPSLSKARDAAMLQVCQNNFKQLNVSIHAYAADHDGYWPDAGAVLGSYTDRTNLMGAWASDPSVPTQLGLLYYNAYITSLRPFICPSRNSGATFWTDINRAAAVPGNSTSPAYINSVHGFQIRIQNNRLQTWTSVQWRGARWKKGGSAPVWGPVLNNRDRYLFHQEFRPAGAPATLAYLADDFSWLTFKVDPQGQYYHAATGYNVGYTDGHVEFVADPDKKIITQGQTAFGMTQGTMLMNINTEDIWNAFDGDPKSYTYNFVTGLK